MAQNLGFWHGVTMLHGHGRAASKKTEETELTEDRHGVPVPTWHDRARAKSDAASRWRLGFALVSVFGRWRLVFQGGNPTPQTLYKGGLGPYFNSLQYNKHIERVRLFEREYN